MKFTKYPLRRRPKRRTSKLTKSLREKINDLLSTAGCAALITVLFGGIVGNIVLTRAQERAKKAELEIIKENKERELALIQENRLSELGEQECIQQRFIALEEKLLTPVGNMIASSEEYLFTPNPENTQQLANTIERWTTEKRIAEATIAYYFHQSVHLRLLWLDLEPQLEDFAECAAADEDQRVNSDCGPEYRAIEGTLGKLSAYIADSWGSPCTRAASLAN